MPPKKAGPKSARTFKICWLGITRYPASLIDVILLYKLTFDRYTCIVAIAWAVSIPRKSALAIEENLFVIKFFRIFAIYSNNMLFSKFSGNVVRLSKNYKWISVGGTLKLENRNWKFRFISPEFPLSNFPAFLLLKTGSTLRSDKFQVVNGCN